MHGLNKSTGWITVTKAGLARPSSPPLTQNQSNRFSETLILNLHFHVVLLNNFWDDWTDASDETKTLVDSPWQTPAWRGLRHLLFGQAHPGPHCPGIEQVAPSRSAALRCCPTPSSECAWTVFESSAGRAAGPERTLPSSPPSLLTHRSARTSAQQLSVLLRIQLCLANPYYDKSNVRLPGQFSGTDPCLSTKTADLRYVGDSSGNWHGV